MGKSNHWRSEAEPGSYPQIVRRYRPALRDSVLVDDFSHAGCKRPTAGDPARYFPNILKRPPIPVMLAMAYLILMTGITVYLVVTQR